MHRTQLAKQKRKPAAIPVADFRPFISLFVCLFQLLGCECGKKGYPTATLKVLDCCGYSSDR